MPSICMDFMNGKILRRITELHVSIPSMVLILSYGLHSWVSSVVYHIASDVNPLQNFKNSRTQNSRTYLCYSNDATLYRSLKWRQSVFAANISAKDFAFILPDTEQLEKEFNIEPGAFGENVCATKHNDTFLHHCCAYSPIDRDNERQEWTSHSTFSYHREVLKDNFFRIEDFVAGKTLFVVQFIQFCLSNNGINISVSAEHRCLGDVPFDPYPEVHITTEITSPHRRPIHKAFHWYV